MKSSKILSFALTTALSLGLSISAQAQVNPADNMASGEIRKIDLDSKKITLKHGDIKNLDMPGMTMVFQIKDPIMLEKVKVGDKVLNSKYGGTEVKIDDKKYTLVREDDILGIIG